MGGEADRKRRGFTPTEDLAGSATAVALGGISDTGPGAASANARVTGAATGGAGALSESRTTSSSVTATASTANRPPGKRINQSQQNAGPPALVPIGAGEAVSNAELTPADSAALRGSMSAGYGGTGKAFSAPRRTRISSSRQAGATELIFDLLGYHVAGDGFDELNLDVKVNGADHSFSFTLLSAAETFFGGDPLDFGAIDAGNQDIEISFALAASKIGDGFGFAYDFGPSKTDLPEPSTWAMMLVGFAGLAVAARSRRTARIRRRPPLLEIALQDDSILTKPWIYKVSSAIERGSPAQMKTYDNAVHDFDRPNDALHTIISSSRKIAHYGVDEEARSDALVRVRKFLDAHLKP